MGSQPEGMTDLLLESSLELLNGASCPCRAGLAGLLLRLCLNHGHCLNRLRTFCLLPYFVCMLREFIWLDLGVLD